MYVSHILSLRFSKFVPLSIFWFIPTQVVTAQQQLPSSSAATSDADLAKFEATVPSLQSVSITVGIRDPRGLPLDASATVRLSSRTRGFYRDLNTKDSADVMFANLLEGAYDLEVQCPGYRPVREQLQIGGGRAFFTAYVYMHLETDPYTANGPPKGLALSAKAVSEVDKGLAAMRKRQYESARNHFNKATQASPSNPDVFYLRGNSELNLGQADSARKDFVQAIAIEPGYEKALIALGQLQLQSGDVRGAIATLNKSFTANGAGWRTYYVLADAYMANNQLREGESAAMHAANLARGQGAAPLLLLGKIQAAAGNVPGAIKTWETLISSFPNAPEVEEARKLLADPPKEPAKILVEARATKIPSEGNLNFGVEDRPWAPPDVDSREYAVTSVPCDLDDVLSRAMVRVKAQLRNLEKFTATEHIEHQEIDKHGLAGPIKSRQFSYIVFVFPYQEDSVFLEESRDGQSNVAAFPSSLATVGLNSLGISVLQPVYRPGFVYQCEGLATVRGDAAWQVRFEEKAHANLGVRRWQKEGSIYNVPIKGRIWLSTTTYDILRIESDLREAVANLELSRDHLQVEYGPVKFATANDQLWLPWNAEMYLELHGKRYHHLHVLSDYMLFGVDTSHKIAMPKNIPPEVIEQTETPQEKPQP